MSSIFFALSGGGPWSGGGGGELPPAPPPLPRPPGGTFKVGAAGIWDTHQLASIEAKCIEAVGEFNFNIVRVGVADFTRLVDGPRTVEAELPTHAAIIQEINSHGISPRLQISLKVPEAESVDAIEAAAGGALWGAWYATAGVSLAEVALFNETNNQLHSRFKNQGQASADALLAHFVDIGTAWMDAFIDAFLLNGGLVLPSRSVCSFGFDELKHTGGVWAQAILEALEPHYVGSGGTDLFDSQTWHYYCDRRYFDDDLVGGVPVWKASRSLTALQTTLYTAASTPAGIKTRIDECMLPRDNSWASEAERAAFMPYFLDHLSGLQAIASIMPFSPWHHQATCSEDRFCYRPDTPMGDAVAAWCLANR
jgi:hypothetical protein